ncbi:hypothetical protein [Pantoea agglomerans]|uniref:Uncharacterized protein n=1 Tax=Enterobacter agglomerans TaxID=549 RepID=A0ACC5RKZ0_ENTAG|nr:hypothetical protein [Pantoea agglomerans]MBK4725304.1 hypothetical protein [Pantoea agglomerans]
MFETPIFTSPLSRDKVGNDPLGLAPVNERLFNTLFPGVNNVVRYIRIYSAICWSVRQIECHLAEYGEGMKQSQVKKLSAHALEKMQILLSWVNRGYYQMAGSRRQFPDHDDDVELLFSTFGSSSAALLSAVSYRPSLTSGLKFLVVRANGTFACTDAGRALADAFDQHARTSPGYEWLKDVTALTTTISKVEEISALLDVGHPSVLEKRAFLSRFYPEWHHELDTPSKHRRQAIDLALHTVRALVPKKKPDGTVNGVWVDTVRRGMAEAFQVPEPLVSIQRCWAVLQLRQLQRLALEVLFHHVECVIEDNQLKRQNRNVDDLAKHVSMIPGYFAELTGTVLDELRHLQSDYSTLYEATRGTDSSLFDLIQSLLDTPIQLSSMSIRAALYALIYCAQETINLNAMETARHAITPDNDACSLNKLAELVIEFEHSPLERLLEKLIKHWVILRHFQVAAERSQVNDGKTRFWFVIGDRGLEPIPGNVRKIGINVGGDRLWHILELCLQSGLLQYDEECGFYPTE